MNERGCVDGMQEYRPQRTRFTGLQFLVIARVGIGHTTATRGYACKLSFVERLQSDCDCSRFRQLLDVDQLIAGAYLSASDNVLHLGYNHRDNRERLSDTCSFSNHAGLHDLCLNLTESCDKSRSACCFWHQYASRAEQWIDDFTCAQGELLNGSRNARLHDRFIKFNFRLSGGSFGACPLRRK